MTGRERLLAAKRGDPCDRKPVISRTQDRRADAILARVNGLGDARALNPDQMVLAEVIDPLGRALARKIPLSRLLREDPTEGAANLNELVAETRADIDFAMSAGADGVFYRLEGAQPSVTTPMEYGGFYLEPERELLSAARGANLNVLYLHGSVDFFEFVSDLPADVFAWDPHSGEAERVRSLWKGAIAAADPAADILLADDMEEAERLLAQVT
jgi:hypothetical protein